MRRILTTRQVVVLAGLAGLLAFAAINLARSEAAGEPDARLSGSFRPLPVGTVTVETSDTYPVSVEYAGDVTARRSVQLGFEMVGRIVRIDVDEGDRVAKGRVLARIDNAELETARREMVAMRDAESAVLSELVTGARSEDIAEARSLLAEAEANLALLDSELARKKRLFERDVASPKELSDATHLATAASAKRDAAHHQLQELLAGTRKERIAAQRARVANLDARIESIDVQLRKSELIAPFAGTITQRLLDEGTVVDRGASLFRLVEDAALEFHVGVPVDMASNISVGQSVAVRISDLMAAGEVTAIVPEMNVATRTIKLIIDLEPTKTKLVAGQVGLVRLSRSVPGRGYWLPVDALVKAPRGLWCCLVAHPTQAGPFVVERRELEVLHTDGDRVFVRGLLSEGERVITDGANRITPGQSVSLGGDAEVRG